MRFGWNWWISQRFDSKIFQMWFFSSTLRAQTRAIGRHHELVSTHHRMLQMKNSKDYPAAHYLIKHKDFGRKKKFGWNFNDFSKILMIWIFSVFCSTLFGELFYEAGTFGNFNFSAALMLGQPNYWKFSINFF